MIIELGMVNVKGISRDFEFGPVTMISGPNFAGKTAMAQAIRIGLLGYDPKQGKQASATYELASGERMQVALGLSNGKRIQRGWQVKRGKLASDGDKEPLTEPMLLDIGQYFGLSRKARIDYVMGLAAEGGIEAKDINEGLHKVRQTIDPMQLPQHRLEQWNVMGRQAAELLAAMDQEGASPKDVVDALLLDWTEAAKLTKGIIVQMAGASQATEQLAEGGPAHQDQTSAIGQKQGAIDLLAKSYGVMIERATKRRKLEQALASAEEEAKTADNAEYLEQLRGVIAGHKEDMATISAELEKLDKEPNAKLQAANTKLTNLRNVRGSMVANVCTGESALEICRERLANLKENLAAKCCATCGAERANWENPEAGFDKLPGLEKAVADAVLALDTYKKNLTEQDQKISAHEKIVSGLVALSNRRSTLQIDFGNLCAMVRTKEDEVCKLSEAGSKFERLKAELEASGPDTAEALTQKVNEIQRSIEVAKGELAMLQAKQNQYARQCQQRLHLEQASAERAKQEEILEVLNAGINEMQFLKANAAGGQLMGFVDTINKFTAGILREPVACDDGEIGYWHGKRWVTHGTMSGTEQALVYIGLGVALAAKSKLKIVVLDEMGILDAENEIKVLTRMLELQRTGVINQFIGMSSRRMVAISGVEYIDL